MFSIIKVYVIWREIHFYLFVYHVSQFHLFVGSFQFEQFNISTWICLSLQLQVYIDNIEILEKNVQVILNATNTLFE